MIIIIMKHRTIFAFAFVLNSPVANENKLITKQIDVCIVHSRLQQACISFRDLCKY